MAIIVTPSGLRQIEQDTPEGWYTSYNANVDTLNFINAVGGFVAWPRDIDLTTFLPTSRYVKVSGGLLKTPAGVLAIGTYPDQILPVSTTSYIWIDAAGNLYVGAALPTTYSYAPVAMGVCDTTKITAFTDMRNPMGLIGGPLPVTRAIASTTYTQALGVNYIRADATTAGFTITLGTAAANKNQLIIIRRIDATANVLTVASSELIDGAANVTMAGPGTMILASTGTTFEVVL